MCDTMVPHRLVEAYNNTDFCVLDQQRTFVMKVGEQAIELLSLMLATKQKTAVFLTAENPFSQTTSASDNAHMQSKLLHDLTAITPHILHGEGRACHGDWPPEKSYLALGLSRQTACELGKKYRQNAIVWADENAVPELILLF